MFCRRNQWEGKNFPRELFHQTRSKRGRVLMHSKARLHTFAEPGISVLTSADGPWDLPRQAGWPWEATADADGQRRRGRGRRRGRR